MENLSCKKTLKILSDFHGFPFFHLIAVNLGGFQNEKNFVQVWDYLSFLSESKPLAPPDVKLKQD